MHKDVSKIGSRDNPYRIFGVNLPILFKKLGRFVNNIFSILKRSIFSEIGGKLTPKFLCEIYFVSRSHKTFWRKFANSFCDLNLISAKRKIAFTIVKLSSLCFD